MVSTNPSEKTLDRGGERPPGRVVAITGASGYLGGLLAQRFAKEGDTVRPLVRTPGSSTGARRFVLGEAPEPGLLADVDVLVHCAYDLALVEETPIWRVNVDGTRLLLDEAVAAGVPRVIVLSSMSAYAGTEQRYGRAKLAIEADALARGAVVVRPGLIYGRSPGGMAGTLQRLARLPIVPVLGGGARQYLAHEDDLADAVVALSRAAVAPGGPVGVANPRAVPFAEVLAGLAPAGRRLRFLPVPPALVLTVLRSGERLGIALPFRSDSLLGLIKPAPAVPGSEVLAALGIELRPFGQGALQ
ncbi:MAG: NAD-dependent epimerase/dehydratase [Acidimicrobiaceae bacterium]|nr:NAD-dependent epimerase/dehydratase [Acidimicrobiaceae bacterium]